MTINYIYVGAMANTKRVLKNGKAIHELVTGLICAGIALFGLNYIVYTHDNEIKGLKQRVEELEAKATGVKKKG